MRVRMLVGLSGPTITLSTGHEWDFPEDEAARLISAGYAVPVAAPKIERAIKPKAKVERR